MKKMLRKMNLEMAEIERGEDVGRRDLSLLIIYSLLV